MLTETGSVVTGKLTTTHFLILEDSIIAMVTEGKQKYTVCIYIYTHYNLYI